MHFNFEGVKITKTRELMSGGNMNADGNIDIILGPRRVHCKEGYESIWVTESPYGACNNESNLKSTSASGYKYYEDAWGNVCHIDPHTPERNDYIRLECGKWQTVAFPNVSGNFFVHPEDTRILRYTQQTVLLFPRNGGTELHAGRCRQQNGLPRPVAQPAGKSGCISKQRNSRELTTAHIRSTQYLNNLTAQFAVANVAQSYYWSGGLICVDNEKLHVYNYSHNEQEARMLHNLTDSYGVNSNHSYVDIMTTNATRYVQNPGAIQYIGYPYTIMNPHLFVPAWIKNTENGQTLSWEYYKYTNAVFHRTGMGFRGFQQIETEDMVNNRARRP